MTPLIRPTSVAVPSAASTDKQRRAVVAPHDRAHDRAQRQVGAHRQVDPAGEDHHQLTECQHRHHGRLFEDVADVLERQEHVGGHAHHGHEQRQDHQRAGLQRRQYDDSVARGRASSRRSCASSADLDAVIVAASDHVVGRAAAACSRPESSLPGTPPPSTANVHEIEIRYAIGNFLYLISRRPWYPWVHDQFQEGCGAVRHRERSSIRLPDAGSPSANRWPTTCTTCSSTC